MENTIYTREMNSTTMDTLNVNLDFLKTSKYYSRIRWEDIDLEMLIDMTKNEMPEEYDEQLFMERLAFRSNSLSNQSQEYDKLASTILITLHERKTSEHFGDVVTQLQENKDIMGRSRPILGEEFAAFVRENETMIESILENERSECFLPTLFGWKTLVRSYLLRSNGGIRERLEHMFLRIALFIHGNDWERTVICFRDLLRGKYTHATPTLFHAGTRRSQMASCFVGDTKVWTTNGPCKMEDVKIGDRVFTHRGNMETVTQLHKNNRGIRKLYRLYSVEGHVVTATGDHEFFVMNSKSEKGWKRLDALQTTDYLMRPHISFRILASDLDFITSRSLQMVFRNCPRIAGVLMASMTVTTTSLSDTELPFNDARVYDMQGTELATHGVFQYQARTLHVPDEMERIQMAQDLQKNRLEIFKWVLMNGETDFLMGWLDMTEKKREITMRTSEEAAILCMAMNMLLQDRYESRDCCVYEMENVAIRSCCYPSSPNILCHENVYYVRFQRKERVDCEAIYPHVYTLGVENDHSYAVNGVIAKNCFLMGTEDSVSGIFKTISDSAQISKWAGGIGIHCSNIRANKSYIYGTNGHSNGILPMLRVYNNVSRYIDQCFAPDVMVATEKGMCRISSIQVGDRIMNAYGQMRPVKKILSYDWDGKVISLDGRRVTSEHDFYLYSPEDREFEYRALSSASGKEQLVFPSSDRFEYNKEADESISMDLLRFCVYLVFRWHVENNGVTMTWCDEKETMTWVIPVLSEYFQGSFFQEEDNMVAVRTAVLDVFLESLIPKMAWISEEKQDFFLNLCENLQMEEEEEEPEWMERMKATIRHSRHKFFSSLCDWEMAEEIYQGKVYDLEMEGDPSYVTEIGLVHNGGGKRNGAFAMYIEPWHGDVMEFILAKRAVGSEDERARDLFYGLWIPDLFMERVEKDEIWSLFCPSTAPGLADQIGPAFKSLYEMYEGEKRYVRQIKARELWSEILRSQMETGTPYMLYKDACNYKSNQKNLGIIKSSNLCVAGDTRLLTPDGILPIHTLRDKSVTVWNGDAFAPVIVRQTGKDVELRSISFSNGMVLSCTAYHKFYLAGEKNPRDASELVVGDRIASYHLPSMDLETVIPSIIRQSMDWIVDRAIHVDQYVMVYSPDRESIVDLFLALQWCGIASRILHQTYRREYELRISREKWSFIQAVSSGNNLLSDFQEMKWTGDKVEDVWISGIRSLPIPGDTYCFTEPLSGKGLFEGICTGQCTEIIEYSDDKEYACCNLASIALPRFLAVNPRRSLLSRKRLQVYTKQNCPFCRLLAMELDEANIEYEAMDIEKEEWKEEWIEKRKTHAITTVPAVFLDAQFLGGFTDVWKSHLCPTMDFKELHRVVCAVVENLNRIIDLNIYPLPETEVSNKRHRPIGIGVQGLADVFGAMRMAFDEEGARRLNSEIFEAIYYGAVYASNQLAMRDGPYSSFKGSPMSKGQFHFEMSTPVERMHGKNTTDVSVTSGRHDWEALRIRVIHHGIRNSLMVAPMPTASTSQILGNTECFEPWTSNLFLRRTNAGEFYVANPLLRRDLMALDMWNEHTMNRLILEQGSVAAFDLPGYLKHIYRTVWEIPSRSLIDMAVDRQRFIDQSQSLNIFVPEASFDLLNRIHFYGWRKGLKTGCYYIRSRAPVNSINFTISTTTTTTTNNNNSQKEEEEGGCIACSA